MLQHQFGMVAAGFGLDHGGHAGRGEPRQQHRGFDLRRCHRRAVEDRQRIARAVERQRQAAAVPARAHPRAHQFQGIEHPPHRPAAQRRVAVEDRRNRAARHRPHHQPAAGAGIAEIERRLRLCESGDPDTVHRPGEIAGSLHPGAQRPHRLGGVEHVLAFEQPRYPGFADRQRAQNQGTVRNRLVAGNADLPGEGAARTGFQRRRVIGKVVGMGQDCVLCAGGRYHMGRAASRSRPGSRKALLTAARQLAK